MKKPNGVREAKMNKVGYDDEFGEVEFEWRRIIVYRLRNLKGWQNYHEKIKNSGKFNYEQFGLKDPLSFKNWNHFYHYMHTLKRVRLFSYYGCYLAWASGSIVDMFITGKTKQNHKEFIKKFMLKFTPPYEQYEEWCEGQVKTRSK